MATDGPVPKDQRPEKAGDNEITLRDTRRSHPSRLSELTSEFVLFTPALISLCGHFDKDPVAYAAGQTGITDVYEITSPRKLMELPDRWGVTLWAIPTDLWPAYAKALGRLLIVDTPARRYARVLYHDLRVPDLLDTRISAAVPDVVVQAFAIVANFGYFYLSSEPGRIPRLAKKRPLAETVQEAATLFTVRNQANASSLHPAPSRRL